MYKLNKDFESNVSSVTKNDGSGLVLCIPFDPANTDYANFKKEILADKAQLQDADGLTLSAAEAKTYVSSLP